MTGQRDIISTDDRAVAALRNFYRRYRRMPSFRELGDELGLRSKNAVSRLVKRLSEKGVIDRDRTGRLIPRDLWGGLKWLGAVEAGFPSSASEEFLDSITLDEWLIANREASFILRVSGNSMKEAGIMPGDWVLVERGKTPQPGDIVIAEVDGEWTMKYWRRIKGKDHLVPANPDYQTICPQQELNIAAVVTGVVRKY